MSKQILKFVILGFAVIGLLTTISTARSVFRDYGNTFVVTRIDYYTEGETILGAGSYDNRSQVTLKEEHGYHAIRTLNMKMKGSFLPGDRVSFDLLGFPRRL